jgi:hypothetical protein
MAVIHPLFAHPPAPAPADRNDIDGDTLVSFVALGTDWSNQELADLFRVKQLLERAGVVLTVDRGITDENDPWFVFCNADDDVFVHICRLGRLYLLDSPSLEAPLTGASFEALIQMFVQRAAVPQLASNVVPLRPRNGLYMHPAIMLTALIWSIYIAADDLVALAQAEELHEGHGPGGALDLLSMHETLTVDEALRVLHQLDGEIAAEARSALLPVGDSQANRNSTEMAGTHMGGQQGMAMAASAVAVSLAVVALSQGLLTIAPEPERGADPTALGTLPELVLVDTAVAVVPTNVGAPLTDPAAPPLEFAAEALAEPASIALATVVQVVANLRLPKISTKLAQDDLDLVLADAIDDPMPQLMLSVPEAAHDNGAMAAMAATSEAPETNVTNFDLASRRADLKAPLEFISGGDLDMIASAGPPLILEGEGAVQDVPLVADPAPSLAAFTPEAQAFVGFLMGKRKLIEIVTLDREIVVIDTSARDSYGDVSFALSWSFEDGSIISTVGHMRDFVDFGLA